MISYKPLFKLLIDKNMTREDLRNPLGISSATFAKMSKNEYVSLETIDKICNYLDCDIADVIEHIKD